MNTLPDPTTVTELSALLDQTVTGIKALMAPIEWAEEEIERASRRHPAQADALFHAFPLLIPTSHLMSTMFVFRSHAREILARVVAGEDTRPGTAAEVCCLCCDSSLVAPLTSAAVGLYARMWAKAFPQQPQMTTAIEHYEALHGSAIDDLEATTRRQLSVPTRTFKSVECQGLHHGEHVNCTFATADRARASHTTDPPRSSRPAQPSRSGS